MRAQGGRLRAGRITGTSSCGLIELDGDVAHVETYFLVHKPVAIHGVGHLRVRAGRYLDLFVRRDGEWRITRRTVFDDYNRLDESSVPPEGHTPGQFSTDDPVYAFLRSTG